MTVVAAFTKDFPWIEPFVASLQRHVPNNHQLFSVNHDRVGATAIPGCGTRGEMQCHGGFLSACTEYETILFADCDMIMQRGFTPEELQFLCHLPKNTVAIGKNLFPGQTLEFEAGGIGQIDGAPVDTLFPDWREIKAWNCGMLACHRTTYERLHDMARPLIPAAHSCFSGVAVIQWLLCYCVGKWLKHAELPQTIHIHGHDNTANGATFDADGNAIVDGVMALFRHAMNLRPPKNYTSPGFT
jgi:hypothetical protein